MQKLIMFSIMLDEKHAVNFTRLVQRFIISCKLPIDFVGVSSTEIDLARIAVNFKNPKPAPAAPVLDTVLDGRN